jgi:hypothetical protein
MPQAARAARARARGWDREQAERFNLIQRETREVFADGVTG